MIAMPPKRTVALSLKKKIAAKQNYKCANSQNKELAGLENYKCLLWQITGPNQGIFDESGYEIDHILEKSISNDDAEENLQALCVGCHRVKTTRFNSKIKKNSKKTVPKQTKPKTSQTNHKISRINSFDEGNFSKISRINSFDEGNFSKISRINSFDEGNFSKISSESSSSSYSTSEEDIVKNCHNLMHFKINGRCETCTDIACGKQMELSSKITLNNLFNKKY